MPRKRARRPEDDFRPLVNAFLRLDRQAQIVVLAIVAMVGLAAAVHYYYKSHHVSPQQQSQQPSPPTVQRRPEDRFERPARAVSAPHLLLGNPSNATSDPANRNNYLMIKPYYALSYNDSAGIPNWVGWRVARSDLGTAPRKRLFDPDNTLPAPFTRIVHNDYSGSGFDRGHLCPHSDRAASEVMSYATFVMTNIIPQAPNVNQKAWANLEEYARELVQKGQRLYILAGPNGKGGRGANGPAERLNGKVQVPAECWKVIVCVPENGLDDVSAIHADSRVIAVMMPNDNTRVGEQWDGYRMTPADIENRTGLRFFDTLATPVAEALRQKLDTTPIAPPRPNNFGRE